jgi:hypothetical protein
MRKKTISDAIIDTYNYFFIEACPEQLKYSIHAIFQASLEDDHTTYEEMMMLTKPLIDEYVDSIRLTKKPEPDDLPF